MLDETATALRLACDEVVKTCGTCPYDQYDMYEPWEESCYRRCASDIDMAACWQRYFEERAGE